VRLNIAPGAHPRLEPRSASSCFPPVHSACLERVLWVESGPTDSVFGLQHAAATGRHGRYKPRLRPPRAPGSGRHRESRPSRQRLGPSPSAPRQRLHRAMPCRRSRPRLSAMSTGPPREPGCLPPQGHAKRPPTAASGLVRSGDRPCRTLPLHARQPQMPASGLRKPASNGHAEERADRRRDRERGSRARR
jgi:hypothetical protein